MAVLLFGINHKTAPLDIRQQFTIDPEARAGLLQKLTSNPSLREISVLSTCNRTEIVTVSDLDWPDADAIFERIGTTLIEFTQTPKKLLESQYFYRLLGHAAIHHLMSVAASLDSLVVGEAQILGQIKAAYDEATAAGTVGPVLHKIYQKAFFAAKRVRTETKIGETPVSMAGVMVSIAESIFDRMEGKNVLLVGSGKMAISALAALRKHALGRLIVTGRNLDKARELATGLGGQPLPLSAIDGQLGCCDLILVSTGSKAPLLFKKQLAAARKGRSRPLFIIDISVPRNVEKSVHDLDNVYLYDMDDLQGVIEKNRRFRSNELAQALSIVDDEAKKTTTWLALRRTGPLIQELTEKAERIRKEELAIFNRRLTHLSPDERTAVESLSRNLTNKLIHDPLVSVKETQIEDQAENSYSIIQAFRTLFHLKADEHER